MEESDLNELKENINSLVNASTKNEAKPLYRKLIFKLSTLEAEVGSYLLGKLKQAINYANEASGQVKDKEHWRLCMEKSWYTFNNGALSKEKPTVSDF